ncbi:MAG: gliding motility-associated-like protein [Saprospiraceae bacterium]|jgi:gliding motility-associated-like protein
MKHLTFTRILITAIFTLISIISIAQPTNDDCINAIVISSPVAYCSGSGAYTTIAATASATPSPACWAATINDVWFSFTAVAADLSVVVLGDVNNGNWGTMPFPEVAIYDNCAATTEITCATDATASGSVQGFANNLTIGQQYFIRVDSRVATSGTFRICVDNYNAPPNPTSDCPIGTVLCDKSAFTVPALVGVGTLTNEINPMSCMGQEYASAWYKWICDAPGTLSFTLTPNNPDDDLDFMVFELPGGLNDCANKTELRCMASGENVGQPLANWVACTGGTGLSLTSTDLTETPGCAATDDNFVAALNMISGKSYALVANNFSNSGNGFSVTWGGTGTFLGPEAEFTMDSDTVCAGEIVTFTDASNYSAGTITNWNWNFGQNSTPGSLTTQGSHAVTYNLPGKKFVRLRATADVGCRVTKIKEVVVEACCETVNVIQLFSNTQDLICARNQDGAVDVTVNNPFIPHNYQWSNGATSQDLINLAAGTYTVTFTDALGCDTIITAIVTSPDYYEVDTLLDQPTCAGGQDGGLELIVNGAVAPYTYNWSPVTSSTNQIINVPNGFYDVTVTDDIGCDTTMTFRVWELELELDSLDDFIIPPLCYGDANGSITATVGNGLAPYVFDWGNGPVSANSLPNLPTGIYNLTITDNNLCQGLFQVFVPQPDSLDIWLEGYDISCFDGDDGHITAYVTGGVGNYSYNWNLIGGIDSVINNLIAGFYSVSVVDGNLCFIDDTLTLTQPTPLIITGFDVIDASCFNVNDGQLTVNVAGGTPPFTYNINTDTIFQTSSTFTDLYAETYIVSIQDDLGCVFEEAVTVNEPWEYVIDAGENVTISLGFTTDLLVQANTLDSVPFNWLPIESLSCNTCANPVAFPVITTTYNVTSTNPTGCPAHDSVTVFVEPYKPLFVPNAFSPNDDGINDYFYVFGNQAIKTVRNMIIFDRWGGKVFAAQNIPANDDQSGWDGNVRGKKVTPQVFVFYVEVEFLDGEVVIVKGDVTVTK